MHRLFVALILPEIVSDSLSTLQYGIDGARWRPFDNFHLTLAFIGETDGKGFEAAIDALATVDAPRFELRLSGVDYFGDARPRAVWAGVDASEPLVHLQAKVANALRRGGLSLEKRRFTPHVTLAYLKHIPQDIVLQYTSEHGLFSCGPFPVEDFHLFSSQLGGDASHYEIEASYALSSSR